LLRVRQVEVAASLSQGVDELSGLLMVSLELYSWEDERRASGNEENLVYSGESGLQSSHKIRYVKIIT